MNTEYRSKGHSKFLLRYHLILVCKYRLQIMAANNISSDIKKLSKEIASRHEINIWHVEYDKDHIHYMIETTPNTNLASYQSLAAEIRKDFNVSAREAMRLV